MNIIRDEKLVKRNRRLAQIIMLSSILIMIAASFVAFRYPEMSIFALGAVMILGFPLLQIGLFFTNRWGRRPRPDELIDKALKGLDKRYTIYHYSSPVSHLLLGPAGVWVLLPYHQRGAISYSRGRWRQKGGGLFLWYLKIFAQEGLGRPDLEAQAEIAKLQRYYKKYLPGEEAPPLNTAMVFTHDQVVINISEDENPPAEALHVKKLKDLIRKAAKSKPGSMEQIQTLVDSLTLAS